MKPKLNELIGVGHKKRSAPECMVRFMCAKCGGEDVLNAYLGVPLCPICENPLEPLSVVRSTPPPDPRRRNALDPERTLTPEQELSFASARPPRQPEVDMFEAARGRRDLEGGSDSGDWLQWRAGGDAPL